MRELLHTTQEVLHNERETKTLALTELSSLRARIAAAIARCGELHKAHDRPRCGDPYADGYDVGVRQAVAQLRAVLEGER